MTAVRGTFADFKTVKTRGVCQLIIEVPIEAADHALATLGGVPQAKAEQWVGIAPVTAPEKPAQTQTAPERVKGGRRARATGILRNTESFTVWLATEYPGHWNEAMRTNVGATPHIAAATIHLLCRVGSCAELDHNEIAGRAWDEIERNYHAAMEGRTPEAQAEQARARR